MHTGDPMSKLYRLKEWFSLEDAAKRLSSGLGEPVSLDDVLQLVVERHIPLSWYARHVPAERVAKACNLLYLLHGALEKDDRPREYAGPVWWHGDWAFRTHTAVASRRVV